MDSVTDYDVFVWLRKFIQFLIPDLNVIRIQTNRNALPKGDFATMALLQKTRLATNARIYTNKPDLKIKDVFQSLQLDIQLDFFGENSSQNAFRVSTLFRDYTGTDFFPKTIAPISCDDPVQSPLIDTEKQFVERWTMTAKFNIVPDTIIEQEFIDDFILRLYTEYYTKY